MDISRIKKEFPIFDHHPDLVYLDNASTTHKPRSVIEAERFFYENQNANVHRGIYGLAVEATQAYENAREKVRSFINARTAKEIIFTSGTTAAVNLVAQSYALERVGAGDNIIISAMEHHSNLIPWQQVCLKLGAELRVIPFDTEGVLNLNYLKENIDKNTKLVAVTHISNTLGTINPIEDIIAIAHQKGVPVFVDAAQSITTQLIDVQALDVDFIAFSGHKLFGPTGIGVLYGKEALLNAMTPYQYGGEMIRDVTFEKTIFAGLPQKFEAGTPNIAGVIALGAAIDFIEKIGRPNIGQHVSQLTQLATEQLLRIKDLEIIGTAKAKTGIISFILRASPDFSGGVHPHDIATILAENNIAIRAGHHCTQPIMDFFDIPGTVRASFSVYNTVEDIEKLVAGLFSVKRFF